MAQTTDDEDRAIAKLANADRLRPFDNIAQIDYLVRIYKGAYTHEDIFYMQYDFAIGLIWYAKEQQAYSERYQNVTRQIHAARNKK